MAFSRPFPQARRTFVFAGLSALLLTGCIGRPGRAPVERGIPARHQVALLVPLTGEDAPVGQALANAARLALADTGNQSVALTIFNTAEGGAAAAAGRALAGGNRLILGPLLSDQVRAIAPLAERARVPVIAYSNDQSATGPGVFILGVVPGQSIDRVVGYARQRGASRFAALTPANVYGQRSAQAYLASVGRNGGQVVAAESYAAPGEARAGARRLGRRGDFDAVLLADTGRVAAPTAPQLRGGVRLLGTDLWAGERNLGATARLRGAWYAAPSDERFGQLVSRYRTSYGSVPPRIASLGYDSMLLTVSATRQWDPRRTFPVDLLTSPEGFVGVDGVFRFGPDRVAQRGLEVRQVTAAGYSVVSPAPASFTR
ncbi:penicillin-binding protein activator [uncultured Sphingomonas sp.]|uniref:penicillin-binding protein activator n=1 Tax=uncultured Sphingomonas sp. TaxID=158754 RepID=UPI0025F35805|nr:penicillin-binding protein activator [uncultured Sphingomonas sp.]